MIGLALMAAGSVTDTQQVQRQLDFIVARCRAEEVVHLNARGANAVSLDMVRPGQLPTVSQNEAFQCVLGKMKERSDLHLDSTGNAAATKADRK